MADRGSWRTLKASCPDTPERRRGYEQARRAFNLGVQVRSLRESCGVSQTELARRMGVKQPVVARIEAGGFQPRIDTLERVAEALGVELMIEFRVPESVVPSGAPQG